MYDLNFENETKSWSLNLLNESTPHCKICKKEITNHTIAYFYRDSYGVRLFCSKGCVLEQPHPNRSRNRCTFYCVETRITGGENG